MGALVVSLSNSASLTFYGVRRIILNKEIRRNESGESSSSPNITRGRVAAKNVSMQRARSKSKEKKSFAFNVAIKGIKSLIVDFTKNSRNNEEESERCIRKEKPLSLH